MGAGEIGARSPGERKSRSRVGQWGERTELDEAREGESAREVEIDRRMGKGLIGEWAMRERESGRTDRARRGDEDGGEWVEA
jgi:hypothetical protein